MDAVLGELNWFRDLSRARIAELVCPGSETDPVKPPLGVLWRRDHPRSKAMTQGLRGRPGEKERLRQAGTARSQPSGLAQALRRCGQSR